VPETSGSRITQVDRVLALKTFDAFRDLSPEELAALAEYARPRFFTKHACVVRGGMRIRALHFILQGEIEVLQTGKPPLRLGPQAVLGGLAALSGDEFAEHARALSPTFTLELKRDDLQDVFEDDFSVLLGVLRSLARAQLAARRKLGERAGFPPLQGGHAARPVGELGLVERLFFLRRAMDFAEARLEALAELAQEASTLRAQPEQVIWQMGELAEHSLVLIDGVLEGTTDTDQQSFEFGPGAVVGGIDAVAGKPRWYRATAKTPLVALSIPAQHLLDVIEDDIDLGMDLLRVFAASLRGLQAQLLNLPPSGTIA
jgi:CRP-like cAMP-binding protein